MWMDRLLGSRVTHAVELTARFAEERHQLLAEDVANVDTPDYRSRRLDPERFQSALREATQRAEQGNQRELELRGERQVWTDASGRLETAPESAGADNALFHDGTNASIESLMTDVQSNALSYSLALNLLGGRYNTLLTAIRGRSQ